MKTSKSKYVKQQADSVKDLIKFNFVDNESSKKSYKMRAKQLLRLLDIDIEKDSDTAIMSKISDPENVFKSIKAGIPNLKTKSTTTNPNTLEAIAKVYMIIVNNKKFEPLLSGEMLDKAIKLFKDMRAKANEEN